MKQLLLKYLFTMLLCVQLLISSCSEDWLEVKRDRALIVPATLKDMRLLLTDEFSVVSDNIGISGILTDEYYLSTETWQTLITVVEKNGYIWGDDIYENATNIEDWDKSYNQVLIANVVLEGLTNISTTSSNLTEWSTVRGSALYLRARAFFNIAQSFAKPYDNVTSSLDLGIPLRTRSDINEPSVRASVKETYEQIISDLEQATELLPESSISKIDPSKAAAYGLQARCYLSMREYDKALTNANTCLQLYNTLIDYNSLDQSSFYPFQRFNTEVIHHAQIDPLYGVYIFFFPNYVDPNLYNSYDDNDLRKALFFYDLGDENYSFKGTYEGSITPFSGISTDEMYLIRAECNARLGETDQAMNDLNTLLINRFIAGTFVPLTASSSSEAVSIILTERRKELLGRGLRWSDLRRLNKEDTYAISLTRSIDGIEYTLPPNDSRYVLQIPEYVIKTSGIQQNPR